MNVLKTGSMIAALMLGAAAFAADKPMITAHERSQGWRLLFDGESSTDWHGFRMRKAPPNWVVSEGALRGSEGAALVSNESFEDFDLEFEWMVGQGGRATVYFHVAEDGKTPDETGPELQLAGEGVMPGSNGGLLKPWSDVEVRTGQWMRGRIHVFGNQVEHYINGIRVLTYLLDGSEWRAAVAASRFSSYRDYGLLRDGPIALAGDRVAFRNIKIRRL